MRRLRSAISTASAEFQRHYAHNRRLAEELRERQERARHARPQRDLDRLERQGKMLPRQRVERLLDPGTPFLEFSSLAANMAYDGESPGASCITGIGIVSGREVVIHADDSSVKGGAWYPLTIKKIVRCLDIAIENRLPVVHLCDSAGGFLQLQSEVFPDRYMGGRIFRNQCILSKLGVKQLALVFGHCTAGGAYIPGLSDYNVIVQGTGAVFLGGPPLVKAATGEEVTVEELGGAAMHTSVSGTCDYPAGSEEEAIAIGREIVAQWDRPRKWDCQREEPEEPYYDPDELYGVLPDDIKKQFEMREIIARLVDGSRFHEYQPNYGTTLVCGFANLWGWKVGILANNGVLFNDSSLKGAHFMELCNQNNTPLVFLQNITGFMVGRAYERAGITKDGAKMIMAQTCSRVPKFTVMCNGSFGAGNYGMCGRAFDGRLLFTWPNHQIGVMGGDQAANTLAEVKLKQMQRNGEAVDQAVIERLRDETRAAYLEQLSAWYSTSEIWDDGIIDPVDTRNALGMAITASLNAPLGESGYGIFRF
ncbi:3-methylcrotonyl-CoA carboxylase beta subunit [Tistlia consotensis]|uniref:3-methylcrotonyl-CoA carboxylase beta subunit n=1 Tax=Tistlia consotensis USBA 355 TaxID=560819 RepID=A0A1Y6BCL1_9PROT|nr:carboxyl transferase domain-containing protein [Tistlia consotensis]SMF04431.1 3-methylcrotonyl-CoA carboxylase beta subunit [Tistlia consotensis USBA 355]SNR54465.1 3-methylcrotonyl-CoA carboxylase beta subunit [Tistlia consotensis]